MRYRVVILEEPTGRIHRSFEHLQAGAIDKVVALLDGVGDLVRAVGDMQRVLEGALVAAKRPSVRAQTNGRRR